MPSIYRRTTNAPATLLMLAAIPLGLSGCASTPPPEQALSHAQSQVDAAETIGANQYAQQSFNQATEKLSKARSAFEQEDYLEARRYAEKAAADASLAQVTTTTRQLKSAIEKLSQEIQALEKELERKS